MHSKGSGFTLGVWGLSCVRQTLRNRPQPSATIRNRPQPSANVRNRSREVAMAVPMAYGKFCKRCPPFGVFQLRVASFRVAGVALCDIPTCFMTCQKKSFVWQAQHFCHRFGKMRCICPCQAQHFGHLRCHFAWQAQNFETCPVACFSRIALSELREAVTRCEFRGRSGILLHVDENRRRPRTKRRF